MKTFIRQDRGVKRLQLDFRNSTIVRKGLGHCDKKKNMQKRNNFENDCCRSITSNFDLYRLKLKIIFPFSVHLDVKTSHCNIIIKVK